MADKRANRPTEFTDTLSAVLRLVKEGRTNKEIARARGVSEQAVKRQVSVLLKRFGVESRAELIHAVYELELRNAAGRRGEPRGPDPDRSQAE